MYAAIGRHDSKLSCPTLVDTEIDTCHDLFRTVSDAEKYIEEQTGTAVGNEQCPLRVVEVIDLDDGSGAE